MAAETVDVDGGVGGATGQVAAAGERDDRDRRLGTEAARGALEVRVEHRLAEDEDAPPDEALTQ